LAKNHAFHTKKRGCAKRSGTASLMGQNIEIFSYLNVLVQITSSVEPNPTTGLADGIHPDTSKMIPGIKRKIPGIDKTRKRLPFWNSLFAFLFVSVLSDCFAGLDGPH
jgi:hypothetical protein